MCELSALNYNENDHKDNYAVITGTKRKEMVFYGHSAFYNVCIVDFAFIQVFSKRLLLTNCEIDKHITK